MASLETSAVPNLISKKLLSNLGITPKPTKLSIDVTSGEHVSCKGVTKKGSDPAR